MRIKMLERVLHDGVRYEADEIREVEAALGEYFCGNGWASDEGGNVATGERIPGVRTIEPAVVKQILG